jgi:hypothetical protein
MVRMDEVYRKVFPVEGKHVIRIAEEQIEEFLNYEKELVQASIRSSAEGYQPFILRGTRSH